MSAENGWLEKDKLFRKSEPFLELTFTDGYAICVIICVTFTFSLGSYFILLKLFGY